MARKRKIPVRKHHGIRDPLKQKAALEEKLKNVINNPPSKDDQSVSKKFSQFMQLLDEAKKPKIGKGENKISKSQKSKWNDDSGPIKQLPNENDESYLRRVNRITSQSLREAEYGIKYGVNVVKDQVTGKVRMEKRPPNEIDELLKSKRKQKNKKEIVPSKTNTLDKETAKKLIKQAIKEDNEERKMEQKIEEYKKDIVKFGEVVHAPPALTVLPRKAVKHDSVARPGKKNNLLLQELLNGGEKSGKSGKTNSVKKKSSKMAKSILKGKRKDLPLATRAMLETEQTKIIDLYRELKKSKGKLV